MIGLLVSASLVYFFVRGPYRANGPLNSYDFAAAYGESRCWLNGQNPFDFNQYRHARDRGGQSTTPAIHGPASPVFLPTSLPVVAPLALLPWTAARLIWCLLSVAVFAWSVSLILKSTNVDGDAKWLLAAAILFFSPTTSGLSTGNPGVICCGLVIVAIYLAIVKRPIASALALGVTYCLKPQLSICAVALFALWRCWKPLLWSFAFPFISLVVSALPAGSIAEYKVWLADLRAV